MNKELELLKPMLEDMRVSDTNGIKFYCGRVGNHKIAAMKCGIGKVNAAIGTVSMIDNYNPEFIINTGVAGALNHDVNVMDMVVGQNVCYHDVWCGGFDDEASYGQVQGLPLYYEGSSKVISLMDNNKDVHCGLIVSGDQFVYTMEQIEAIKKNFPDALAVDMESGAIAQTCYVRNTPFVSMRVISDSPVAGHDNSQEYSDFWVDAPAHSLAAVRDILKQLD
jgi:adenosylhomocysteine nucleosidase